MSTLCWVCVIVAFCFGAGTVLLTQKWIARRRTIKQRLQKAKGRIVVLEVASSRASPDLVALVTEVGEKTVTVLPFISPWTPSPVQPQFPGVQLRYTQIGFAWVYDAPTALHFGAKRPNN